MRVLHVVDELSPVTCDSGPARANRLLCAAQAQQGASVDVTVALRGADPAAGLARQLEPFRVAEAQLDLFTGTLPGGDVSVAAISAAQGVPATLALDAAVLLAHEKRRWPDVIHVSETMLAQGFQSRVEELAAIWARPMPALFIGRELRPGIDETQWSSLTDSALPASFDSSDLSGKATCKLHAQRQADLPARSKVPLIAAVGPFERELLTDLLRAAEHVPAFQLIVVLDADRDEQLFHHATNLADPYPSRIAIHPERGEALERLRHLVIAAADFTFVSRGASPGPSELYPLAYGSLLIAPAVDSLAGVVSFDLASRTGSGFLFEPAGGPSVVRAVRRAVHAHELDLSTLRRRLMDLDLGWQTVAMRYLDRYRGALEARPTLGNTENLSDT